MLHVGQADSVVVYLVFPMSLFLAEIEIFATVISKESTDSI